MSAISDGLRISVFLHRDTGPGGALLVSPVAGGADPAGAAWLPRSRISWLATGQKRHGRQVLSLLAPRALLIEKGLIASDGGATPDMFAPGEAGE